MFNYPEVSFYDGEYVSPFTMGGQVCIPDKGCVISRFVCKHSSSNIHSILSCSTLA